ncbi:MAG: hypothetical protein O3A78_13120 [Nitrospinae bacterium]|jgi:hypothetical protein|nr:hypothetical protein [Nitrospinota bacterium]MDA1110731.1 hypothetical protein [Nitrospinota bacterium]
MAISEIFAQTPIFDSRSYSASVQAAFTGGLSLKTREGDRVDLSFANEQSLAGSESQTKTSDDGTVSEISSSAVAASQYSLAVQGDLNEEELNAIQRLVDQVGPIARSFFARAEIDLEGITGVLAGSLGVITEIELELERVITTTFSFQEISSNRPIEISDPGSVGSGGFSQESINTDAIRNLPELVFAAVEAELKTQADQLPKGKTILRSLNDLMALLQEQLGQFLSPLKYSAEPRLKPLPQGIETASPVVQV